MVTRTIRKRLCGAITVSTLCFGTMVLGDGGELVSEERRFVKAAIPFSERIQRSDHAVESLVAPQFSLKVMVPDSTTNYTLKTVQPGGIYIPNMLKQKNGTDPTPHFFQLLGR